MKRIHTDAAPTNPTTTENKEERTMKTAALTPIEKAAATVAARHAHARELLTRPHDIAARIELVNMISRAVAYHKSGKIEGLFSLDVSCKNGHFCQAMQALAPEEGCVCSLCYTNDGHDLAHDAHAITGDILSEMELTPAEAAAVAIPSGFLRFDCDGELINLTHAVNNVRITAAHPLTNCTQWTKRKELIKAAILQEGKPANLIIGYSSPFINCPLDPAENPEANFIFTVYTPAAIAAALARGEYPCNGQKCIVCGFHCYKLHPDRKGPVMVAEVLRRPCGMSKAAFEKLCAAIDARTM